MYNDTGIIAENADGFIAGHAVDNGMFMSHVNKNTSHHVNCSDYFN